MISKTSKKQLSELANDLGSPIWAWSLVNDNWTENIESYLDIENTNDIVFRIWVENMYAGIFFTANKIKRHTNKEEYEYFCSELAETLINLIRLVNEGTESFDETSFTDFENLFFSLLKDKIELYYSGNSIQHYYDSLCVRAVPPLTNEIIEAYANSNVDSYEELMAEHKIKISNFKESHPKN